MKIVITETHEADISERIVTDPRMARVNRLHMTPTSGIANAVREVVYQVGKKPVLEYSIMGAEEHYRFPPRSEPCEQ